MFNPLPKPVEDEAQQHKFLLLAEKKSFRLQTCPTCPLTTSMHTRQPLYNRTLGRTAHPRLGRFSFITLPADNTNTDSCSFLYMAISLFSPNSASFPSIGDRDQSTSGRIIITLTNEPASVHASRASFSAFFVSLSASELNSLGTISSGNSDRDSPRTRANFHAILSYSCMLLQFISLRRFCIFFTKPWTVLEV